MLRTARLLIAATLAYNAAEGVVAIWAGTHAGSISLVAFGADSYLEMAAASVVLWRLGITNAERGERVEQQALRFIGWTFIALAAGVIYQSGWSLAASRGASESIVGIALAGASVTLMPAVALWKLRTAAKGNISALAAEAKETLACSYLSVTLLVGLVANALLGWWWLDGATALLLTPWLVREGLEDIRGENDPDDRGLCFCAGCLYGLRSCRRPCCVAG